MCLNYVPSFLQGQSPGASTGRVAAPGVHRRCQASDEAKDSSSAEPDEAKDEPEGSSEGSSEEGVGCVFCASEC